MRAKICGVTNLSDAKRATNYGAWALGFNFCPQSLRYIEPAAAGQIIQQMPETILKIGIVLDSNGIDIEQLLTSVGLDFLQVYGVCDAPLELKKRMILSLSLTQSDERPDDAILNQYGFVLLDAPSIEGEALGGSGRLSDWEMACRLAKKHRLILAGGLNNTNIKSAIATVRPYAVDVASGVQRVPGKLDVVKLNQFLRQVKYDT